MRVLVCGASGFAGSAVVSDLLAHAHAVRAFDVDPVAEQRRRHASDARVECVSGSLDDYEAVRQAMDGCAAVVNAIKYVPPHDSSWPGQSHGYTPHDAQPWLVHIQGLWNVLENARALGVGRVVHISSCQTVWPHGGASVRRFTAETRSQEGDIYGISKRLQEEMCRQFYDAHSLPILVLRADGIVDTIAGTTRRGRLSDEDQRQLAARPPEELYGVGAVCRWDLASACRVGATQPRLPPFDVLHVVGQSAAATAACNVGHTSAVLGLRFRAVTVHDMLHGRRRPAPGTAATNVEARL